MKKKSLRIILSLTLCVLLVTMFSATAFAAGDVSGAIEGTWNAAKSQVQTVVNNVVFPVIDMILAILIFVKVRQGEHDERRSCDHHRRQSDSKRSQSDRKVR